MGSLRCSGDDVCLEDPPCWYHDPLNPHLDPGYKEVVGYLVTEQVFRCMSGEHEVGELLQWGEDRARFFAYVNDRGILVDGM